MDLRFLSRLVSEMSSVSTMCVVCVSSFGRVTQCVATHSALVTAGSSHDAAGATRLVPPWLCTRTSSRGQRAKRLDSVWAVLKSIECIWHLTLVFDPLILVQRCNVWYGAQWRAVSTKRNNVISKTRAHEFKSVEALKPFCWPSWKSADVELVFECVCSPVAVPSPPLTLK